MEYVKLIMEVFLRWTLMGIIVLYVLTYLSYIAGLIESGCSIEDRIKIYLTKAPPRIFKVWIMQRFDTIRYIILWPLTIIDYGGVLYDEYSQLYKKS